VIGTQGIALRAKGQGFLASASEAIQKLSATGLYLGEDTIALALERRAGEAWIP